MVKLSSPNINNVLLIGCVLTYCTVFIKTTNIGTPSVCTVRMTIYLYMSQRYTCTWASAWQNQQNACAPSEDQPGHRPSLIRVFLCAQWEAKDPSFFHTDSEESDQIGWKPRLIWVFAERTWHFVGFVKRRFTWYLNKPKKKKKQLNVI